MEFNCSQCGACCMVAGRSGLMPSKEDGSCEYLTDDNKCSIYDDRPDICSIRKTYKKRKSKGMNITYKEYCKISSIACNELMDLCGIDDKYKLNPGEYDLWIY